MQGGASGPAMTLENTIQDLVMSLSGAALAALIMATVLWPEPGTPETLFGWT
jgi:hypothetical protein